MPTATGEEVNFNFGIKNNKAQTDTNPVWTVTQGEDGTYGRLVQLGNLQPQTTNLPIAHTTLIPWGDSLTQGAGGLGTTYPSTIASITGFTVTNKGVGGETSTQIKDRFIADTGNYDKSVIIWAGRNNYLDPETVKSDIATMVATLTHTRYLIVGVINGNYPSEYKNQSGWETITQLNLDLQEIYGEKFVDIRPYLVSLHNNSAQDLIDFANDIPPDSLRVDNIHLSATGYTLVGQYLNQRLGILFEHEYYLQGKDVNGYLNLYQVMRLIGNETVSGIKTFTNTTNTITNGMVFNNSGNTTAGWALGIYNTQGGNGIYGSNTSNGTLLYMDIPGTNGYGVRGIASASAAAVFRADLSGNARGFIGVNSGTNRTFDVSSSANNTSFYSASTAGGSVGFWSTGIGTHFALTNNGAQPGILAEILSTGIFASINSATASTADLFQFKKNNVLTSKINHNGEPTFAGNGSIANNWSVGGALTMPAGVISFTGDAAGIGVNPSIARSSGRLILKSDSLNAHFISLNTDNLTAVRTRTIANVSGEETISLSGSATLDFPSVASGASSELNITVTGAVDGDVVALGIANSSTLSNTCYTARVSATDTVTVKFNNYSGASADPGSGLFKVKVFK